MYSFYMYSIQRNSHNIHHFFFIRLRWKNVPTATYYFTSMNELFWTDDLNIIFFHSVISGYRLLKKTEVTICMISAQFWVLIILTENSAWETVCFLFIKCYLSIEEMETLIHIGLKIFYWKFCYSIIHLSDNHSEEWSYKPDSILYFIFITLTLVCFVKFVILMMLFSHWI